MSKHIIIAGCYRSGTTALFNIVRLILKYSDVEYDAYFWNGKTESNKEYQLIKTHTFNEGLADKAYKVFVAHRKYDDVYSSMLALSKTKVDNKFSNAGNIDNLDYAWSHAERWVKSADYIQNFIDLNSDIRILIHTISNILNMPNNLSEKLILEFKGLRAPEKGLDEITLLTETHKKQQ